jgi:hypothetical protein
MKGNTVESKFKYLLGEQWKEQFDGVTPCDSQTESHFVRSNGIFTAVIID